MKRFLSFLAALACTTIFAFTLSADDYEHADLYINSESGIYAKGEKVEVYAVASEGAADKLWLSVRQNGEYVVRKTIRLRKGVRTKVYSATYNEPAHVVVHLGPEKGMKEITSVGWIVSPEEITPTFEAPADLYEFWDGQIARMRETPMSVKMVPVQLEGEDARKVKSYHVEVSMPEGRPVMAYVSMPIGASYRSLPIYIRPHGANSIYLKVTQSDLETTVAMAKKGFLAMDVNAHGMEDGAPQDYYQKLNDELKDYYRWDIKDRESFYFRLMFLRMQRALDYMTGLPEWDGKTVLLHGGSQGGAQSLALAGFDPRVTHVVTAAPAMTDMGSKLKGFAGTWPTKYTRRQIEDRTVQEVLPYYDGSLLIGRFKGDLYIECGQIDTLCPCNTAAALYNNARNVSHKEIHYFPYRKHGGAQIHSKDEYNEKITGPRNRYIWSVGENPLATISHDPGLSSIFRHWGFIGDSLSSGEFEYVKSSGDKGYWDMFEYSWGQFICRATGSEGVNYSQGGETAIGWLEHYWDNHNNKRGIACKDEPKQAYIIALGVNDKSPKRRAGYDLGNFDTDIDMEDWSRNASTFVGCYAGIIQRVKSIQPDAKFFVVVPPIEDRYPQYVAAIRHMADIFSNTYLIDLARYVPEMYAKDSDFRRDYYLIGHLSPAGYQYTAWMFMTYIDWIIRHNMDDFKEIGFIGKQKP